MSESKPINIFELGNKLSAGYDLSLKEDDYEKVNMFVLLRYLSSHLDFMKILPFVNNRTMSNRDKIIILQSLTIPKKRKLKWLKNKTKEENNDINIIMKVYDVNYNTAFEYYKFFSQEELYDVIDYHDQYLND